MKKIVHITPNYVGDFVRKNKTSPDTMMRFYLESATGTREEITESHQQRKSLRNISTYQDPEGFKIAVDLAVHPKFVVAVETCPECDRLGVEKGDRELVRNFSDFNIVQ